MIDKNQFPLAYKMRHDRELAVLTYLVFDWTFDVLFEASYSGNEDNPFRKY